MHNLIRSDVVQYDIKLMKLILIIIRRGRRTFFSHTACVSAFIYRCTRVSYLFVLDFFFLFRCTITTMTVTVFACLASFSILCTTTYSVEQQVRKMRITRIILAKGMIPKGEGRTDRRLHSYSVSCIMCL